MPPSLQTWETFDIVSCKAAKKTPGSIFFEIIGQPKTLMRAIKKNRGYFRTFGDAIRKHTRNTISQDWDIFYPLFCYTALITKCIIEEGMQLRNLGWRRRYTLECSGGIP